MVIQESVRKIFKVALSFVLQTLLSARFIALTLFSSMYIVNQLLPLRQLAREHNQTISYASFVFSLQDPLTRLVIFTSLFFTFANLPIRGHYALTMIHRTGKRVWLFSQAMYVMLLSFIYVGIVFMMSVVALIPFNLFENRWGKILYGLTNHPNGDVPDLNMRVSKIVLDTFSPDEAARHILMVMLLLCVFFGLVAIVGNYLHQNLGTIVGFVAVFLQLFIYDTSGIVLYFISPLTWLTLSEIALSTRSSLPSVQYSEIALLLMNGLLLGVIAYLGRNQAEIVI